MRKIFLILFTSLIFTFSSFDSKALTPSEKTSDYIIFPFNVFESLSYTQNYYETLPKYFEAAKLHCSTYDKSAYIFYKIDRGYRVYDQYEGGFTGSVRFICSDNYLDALRLFNYSPFGSMLRNSKYQNAPINFDMRETAEVAKKRADQQLLVEKERQKKLETASIDAKKIYEEKTSVEKKSKLNESNKTHEKKCEGGLFSKGYKKGTEEFNNCIKREEKLAALDIQKKELMNEEKNKRIALEENKKQKDIQQKRELDSAKIKEEQIKLSKMKPEDRHAYTCTEKFGFRKGSDKFKDCVFELYKVETELEKIELQKKIVEANLEVARTKERAARTEQDRNNALLERQTLAQERTAAAAAQQARIANFESSQRMIDDGLALMRGDRNLAGQVRQPQQRLKATCTYTGGFMNCF